MSTETPERYTPEPRPYEEKDCLYEHYWRQGKTTEQLAEMCDTSSSVIVATMQRLGVPRRRTATEHQPSLSDDQWMPRAPPTERPQNVASTSVEDVVGTMTWEDVER